MFGQVNNKIIAETRNRVRGGEELGAVGCSRHLRARRHLRDSRDERHAFLLVLLEDLENNSLTHVPALSLDRLFDNDSAISGNRRNQVVEGRERVQSEINLGCKESIIVIKSCHL